MTQLAAHWPQLRLIPIPLITFLRPAEMLDKNVVKVVEPCDAKMFRYIKRDIPNLGQFAVLWQEEGEGKWKRRRKRDRIIYIHRKHVLFSPVRLDNKGLCFTLSCFTDLKVLRLHRS